MSGTLEAMQKQKIFQSHLIQADSSGTLPTRIEILKAGSWPPTSNKGKLEITIADLYEMKANFDAGIAVPGGKQAGLPIDFMHNEWDRAAAWIKELEVDGATLFAIVEWSKAGEDAVRNKEFKCVSPSFYPACLGMWSDPENADITARNVLVGAGLTNIPFFKDLKPIMASQNSESDSGEENIIYLASEKENRMTLDEVRGKDVDSLTEDEKNFLSDNKDALNADERAKFGFEPAQKAPVSNPVEAQITADQRAKIEADVRAKIEAENKAKGLVVVEASTLDSLKESQTRFETKEAEAIVVAHIGRGAIKADTKDVWVERLVNADKDTRALFEKTLSDIPDNTKMDGKKGDDSSVEATATEQIKKLAQEKVNAAVKDGKKLSIGDAMSEVMKENSDLAQLYQTENLVGGVK